MQVSKLGLTKDKIIPESQIVKNQLQNFLAGLLLVCFAKYL